MTTKTVGRVAVATLLATLFLGACSDDDADDATDTTVAADDSDATDGGDSGTGTPVDDDFDPADLDVPPDDSGAITEPTWIDGEVGSFTATDVTTGDLPDDAAHLWVFAAQEAEAQDPGTPSLGLGAHDHAIALLDTERPCGLFNVIPGPDATEETVTTNADGLADQVDLGDGLVDIKDTDTVNAGLDAGLLEEVYLNLHGTCVSSLD
jgi:hypothetical protein